MEATKDRPQTDGEPESATTLSQARAFGSTRRDCFKLALGSMVFILLTVSIFLYQFSRIEQGEESFTWSGLRLQYLWLMLLCLPFDNRQR